MFFQLSDLCQPINGQRTGFGACLGLLGFLVFLFVVSILRQEDVGNPMILALVLVFSSLAVALWIAAWAVLKKSCSRRRIIKWGIGKNNNARQ